MNTRPVEQFAEWYQRVHDDNLPEPTHVALGTVGADGQPSVRIVLLKHFDELGFVFYTNSESRKGRELTDTPKAALCFYWPQHSRQVRIEGLVELVTSQEADAYFASRPRRSQLGAWASQQSRPLPSRDQLLATIDELDARYADQPVPRPPYWTGFRLVPRRIEFWTGVENRLHVRDLFTFEDGNWSHQLLYP